MITGFTNEELLAVMPSVRHFAKKLSGWESDDLVQDVMCRCLAKKHLFANGTNLCGWALKITYNLYLTQRINESKIKTTPIESSIIVDRREDPEVGLIVRDVTCAVDKLTYKQRKIFLAFVNNNEPSYADLAVQLNVPVSTVRQRLYRARKALRIAIGTRE